MHRLAEVPDPRDVPDERVAVERIAIAPSHRLQVGREARAHDLHLALVDAMRVPHHDVVDLVAVLEYPNRVDRHQEPTFVVPERTRVLAHQVQLFERGAT